MSNTDSATSPAGTAVPAGKPPVLSRSDLTIVLGSAGTTVLAGAAFYAKLPSILTFLLSAAAIALLAALVGRCVERLGDKLGSGATGVLQSALGNLPELFIAYFALRKGLLVVVQAAIIGSILANLLLVLGAAFVVGGLKWGTQRFDHSRARTTSILLMLATAALVLPSIAANSHSEVAKHSEALSIAVAIVLLAVFALSLPASLKRATSGPDDATADAVAVAGAGQAALDAAHASHASHLTDTATDAGVSEVGEGYKALGHEDESHHEGHWPLWLSIVMLTVAGVAAALVSDWFVEALTPTMEKLHISQAFAGLVIVAIAGNAVENFVGIQLAARNQADFALAVIINSPLQIALVLAPALVLLSLLTATTLTLVFSPLLVAAVVVSVVISTLIVFDGESNWLEGAILVALYAIVATLFWWG